MPRARIVLAQLEGSGRGALGAYDSTSAQDLQHFLLQVRPAYCAHCNHAVHGHVWGGAWNCAGTAGFDDTLVSDEVLTSMPCRTLYGRCQ